MVDTSVIKVIIYSTTNKEGQIKRLWALTLLIERFNNEGISTHCADVVGMLLTDEEAELSSKSMVENQLKSLMNVNEVMILSAERFEECLL